MENSNWYVIFSGNRRSDYDFFRWQDETLPHSSGLLKQFEDPIREDSENILRSVDKSEALKQNIICIDLLILKG